MAQAVTAWVFLFTLKLIAKFKRRLMASLWKQAQQALGLKAVDTQDVTPIATDTSKAEATSNEALKAAQNLKTAEQLVEEGKGVATSAAGSAARNAAGSAAKESRAAAMQSGAGRLASALAASDAASNASNSAYTNTYNSQLSNATNLASQQDTNKANLTASALNQKANAQLTGATANAQAANSAAIQNAATQNQAEANRNAALSNIVGGAIGTAANVGIKKLLSDEKAKKFKLPSMIKRS